VEEIKTFICLSLPVVKGNNSTKENGSQKSAMKLGKKTRRLEFVKKQTYPSFHKLNNNGFILLEPKQSNCPLDVYLEKLKKLKK